MGFYAGFVIGETGLWPPVAVDNIPQSGVTDNETKVEAFNLAELFGV